MFLSTINIAKRGLAALALTALAASVFGQGPSQTHRGDNARRGLNPNFTEPGPGFANLRWWNPLQSQVGADVTVDNLGANYAEPTGAWFTPSPLDESPDWRGTGNNPYRYAFVVPSTSGTGDPTAGATATARWTVNGTPGTHYALYVWFPSSGTIAGGALIPNSNVAVYRIDYNNGQSFVDRLGHLGGGSWMRLGRDLGTDERLFRMGATGQITITLYNTVPRDANDNLMGPTINRIVCADSVLATPNPGQIFGSPVVRQIGPGTNVVTSVRNASVVDVNDPSGTIATSVGTVHAVNASGPNISLNRWTWRAQTQIPPTVIDNTHPEFFPDPGWTVSTARPGFFGSNYMTTPTVFAPPPGTAVARWRPTLPKTGPYEVWVWLFPAATGPANTQHTNDARYVVDENGTPSNFSVDQRLQGPGWVRIGGTFMHDPLLGGLELHLQNWSSDASPRLAMADAAMFVYAGVEGPAMYSTPTMANVDIRRNNGGPVLPTEVVFVASDDGRVYCLDANGNGNGTTFAYWSYPSTPDVTNPNWTDPNDPIDGPLGNRIPYPGPYGVSSMLVQNIGGRDILYIASNNGRVYAIDCEGRGDYDPLTGLIGSAVREWTWPRATYSGGIVTLDPPRPAFAGSVAYDSVSNQVFAAGTEGRIFALEAPGNGDRTTDMNWAWPSLTTAPVGVFTSTPAIGGGRVIVPSYDGRVYARDVDGTTNPGDNWQYPASPNPGLFPFTYTSAAYVPASELGFPAPPSDLVYFVNDNGFMYCVRGDTGALVFDTPDPQSGVMGSPYFTDLVPSGLAGAFPTITFGTNGGAFLGMYANPAHTNSDGGRLSWGWQSRGDRVFASPAVGYGWMYHAGVDGYLYAFSTGGVISNDPGFPPPGDDIGTPDDPIVGFDDLKFKFISRPNYSNLRQSPPVGDPFTIPDLYPPPTIPALEWGETIFVLAYDFEYAPGGQPQPTIRFTVNGPGGLTLRFDRPAELVAGATPGQPGSGFATVGIPLNANGNNFFTPGDQIKVDVEVLDNGRVYNPTSSVPRLLTVANPLAATTQATYVGTPNANKSIGWNTNPSDPENLINGSPNKPLLASAGQVIHGQSGKSPFHMADRSRILEMTGSGLTGVRASRGDAQWQGSAAAVIKPLPYVPSWEVMPTPYPNLSRDYPDIDRSLLDIIADPFGTARNALLTPVQLLPPLNFDPNTPLTRLIQGVEFSGDFDVERYQPANLSIFIDAAGDSLPGGYISNTIIYVDSNSNGRPDGVDTQLTGDPTNVRREAYRSLNVGLGVPIDESMSIAEPTVDLGSEPHSLGYTPLAPWQPGNLFVPDITTGAPFATFFKPFTLYNTGNVNLLDLRIAKRIGEVPGPSYYSVPFISDAVDPLAWIDGNLNIISNINPPYAINNGALDASGNPRVTLHKARAGDRFPTTLTTPDVPYGVTPPPNSQPLIGVAVPLGFPVGEYRQLVNVVEDSYLVGGLNDQAVMLQRVNGNLVPLEAFSDPTMTVRFLNRETRLTGGRTTGSAQHVDDDLGAPTNFRWTNTAPTGFRDSLGNLHMSWQANRDNILNTPGVAQTSHDWNLFFGFIQGAIPSAGPGASPLRDLMAWTPNTNTRFWNPFAGPNPTDPIGTLFAGGGVVVDADFTEPSFAVNVRATLPNQPTNTTVFWNGTARKDADGNGSPDGVDSRTFYAAYSVQPGGGTPTLGPTSWLVNDSSLEKRRIRPMHFGANGLAIFWSADVNGHSRMFQNVRVQAGGTGDQTANWTQNVEVNPGVGFSSVSAPSPIERSYGVDVVFSGLLRDASQPEIFMGQWETNGAGVVRGLRNLPERIRETLVREADGSYRARGVNWNVRQGLEVWIRRPNQNAVRIDLPATRSTDDASGIVSSDSAAGGKIYMDPHTGKVTFSSAPGTTAQLELRYTPRVIRVSELGSAAGHTNPSSFLDQRFEWNKTFYSLPGSYTPIGNAQPRVARMWHFYQRGAAGPGQSRRPYLKTQRPALRTNYPIALDGNGNPMVNVIGMQSPFYQVDPTGGKLYFGLQDEGRQLTVTYWYRNDNGSLQFETVNGRVQWQVEYAEQPVPIEQAVDEDSVFVAPDLFDDPVNLRAGLVWVFFTSTRGGTRDVYYISVAPRLGPIVVRG